MKQALLIIDMQAGCFAGQLPAHDLAGTVERINRLSVAIRPRGPVVFIQHNDAAEGLGHGSEGWQLLPSLDRQSGDPVVEKCACDSFLETPLDALLAGAGVTEVIITGFATDFCVDTTVRSAAARGYNVTVAADAHTLHDRPHLSAAQIIAHHHFMWSELLLPRGRKIRVVPTGEILSGRSTGAVASTDL